MTIRNSREYYIAFQMKRSPDWLTIILSIVLMGDNRKILLESLITNQGPLNGSYETHWPFNGEDAPINAERLTISSANFLVNHSILLCDIFTSKLTNYSRKDNNCKFTDDSFIL